MDAMASAMPWAIDEGALRISWRSQWLPLTPLDNLACASLGTMWNQTHPLEQLLQAKSFMQKGLTKLTWDRLRK
jgi:hypothetical protein